MNTIGYPEIINRLEHLERMTHTTNGYGRYQSEYENIARFCSRWIANLDSEVTGDQLRRVMEVANGYYTYLIDRRKEFNQPLEDIPYETGERFI
jgi:hypothetical protein